jgi:uncharacterized membrane protein
MHEVEFSFYKVIVLITAAMAMIFSIINTVYFNNIRNKGNCGEVSTSTATTMVWLNIILAIFSGLLLIWSFYRIIITGKEESDIIHKHTNNINYEHEIPTTYQSETSSFVAQV